MSISPAKAHTQPPRGTSVTRSPMGRARRALMTPSARRIVAIAVALAVVLGAASPAQARLYRVYACHTPDGTYAPLEPKFWSLEKVTGAVAADRCANGGAVELKTDIVVPVSPRLGPGALAALTFTKRTFHQVSYRRRVSAVTRAGSESRPEFVTSVGADPGVRLERCAAIDGCAIGFDAFEPVRIGKLDANRLRFEVRCSSTAVDGACVATKSMSVSAAIDSIELELEDSADPYGGAADVAAIEAGTPRSGTLAATFSVGDTEVGVATAVATIDGVEVSRVAVEGGAAGCRPVDMDGGIVAYTAVEPCAGATVAALPIDTNKVLDGRHTVRVSAIDGVGNRAEIYRHEITVDNVPPPVNRTKPAITGDALATGLRPGDVLTATNGAWSYGPGAIAYAYRWQRSGDGGFVDIGNATGGRYTVVADDLNKSLRLAVTATTSDGSTTAFSEATGIVRTGATIQTQSLEPGTTTTSTGGDPSSAQLVVDREQRTIDVRHGAKIVVTGRLVDADGQPIAGAAVDVFEQLTTTAASWVKLGAVTTDTQGGYAYRPRTTASRRLRFAYADRRQSADYRATREVLVSVTAGMKIGTKRHVLRRHGLIRLKGRVVVDSLPKTGAWVEVQVLDAGVWRTVAARRTSSKGLWTFKHRLRQSAGITFKFRARLRTSGDVASAEATSAPVRVRVR